jgi:mycothiol synthase
VNGIQYRPLRPSDDERVVDILLASRAVDGPHEPVSRAQLRHHWFDFPGLDLERDTVAATDTDGLVVGFAGAIPRERPIRTARVFIPGSVHPANRRAGIGRRLLRTAEVRAREQLAVMPPDLPRELVADVQANSRGATALLEAEGFRAVREFATMRRNLDGDLPTPPEPTGITFTTWRDDLGDETRLAHNDAFRDHWGSDPLGPERWEHFVRGSPGFDPASSWLALDGRTVAGYALCQLAGPQDHGVGWLGTVGVRRDYRRRGIGAAVVARSMDSFRSAGVSSAILEVDSENPTGAVRVYAGLGFEITERSIVYRKDIPA